MNAKEIKKRYTRVSKTGNWHRVEFMVVPQYFTVFETDEGEDHATHFQKMLVKALERMQVEMVHGALNELGVD